MVDRDCSLCRYKNAICSIASVGKVRSLLSLKRVMAASAVIRGSSKVDETDLEFALRTALPHRLVFNDASFLAEAGTMHNAVVRLVNRYINEMERYAPHLEKIMALPANPTWQQVESLMKDVQDAPPLRAILDDIILMMKETCEKRGERIPDAFAEHISTGKAINIFTPAKTAQKAP